MKFDRRLSVVNGLNGVNGWAVHVSIRIHHMYTYTARILVRKICLQDIVCEFEVSAILTIRWL